MLLPSEPPPPEHDARSSSAPAASAPVLSENDSCQYYSHTLDPEQFDSHDRTPIPSAPSLDTLTADVADTRNFESSASDPAPSYSGPAEQSARQPHDKQELERQRLLNEVSAPNDDDQQVEHDGHRDNHSEPRNPNEPSAPALTEEDIIRQSPPAEESPPQYER